MASTPTMILGLLMVILGMILSLAPWVMGITVVEEMIIEIKITLTSLGIIIFSVGCILLFGNLSYE